MCRLYKAYQKLYASMHDKATGPHKTQFRRDEDYGKSTIEHPKKLKSHCLEALATKYFKSFSLIEIHNNSRKHTHSISRSFETTWIVVYSGSVLTMKIRYSGSVLTGQNWLNCTVHMWLCNVTWVWKYFVASGSGVRGVWMYSYLLNAMIRSSCIFKKKMLLEYLPT